jgi:Tfp pilus assembly protein PilF
LCGLCLLFPALVSADAGNGGSSSSSPAPNPQKVTADYDTGYRALQAGDYKVAIRAFQQVLDADPNHAMAYTNMAYSYRQLGNYKKSHWLV